MDQFWKPDARTLKNIRAGEKKFAEWQKRLGVEAEAEIKRRREKRRALRV